MFGGSSSGHSFGLDFADRITAPLFKLERQLERLVALPNKVAASFGNLNRMLGDTKNLAMAAASAGLGALTGGIGLLVDAMKGAVDWGIKFGKTVIEAAKSRGLVMTALETQLGDRGQADHLFGQMLKMAQLTPSSNLQIVEWGKRLLTSQFTGGKFDAALKAITDVQAQHSNREAGMYTFLLQRVKSKGIAQKGDFNSAIRYISGDYILESLSDQLGIRGLDKAKSKLKVFDLMKKGQVGSETFISATQEALLKQLKQKELGSYGILKGTSSLAGVLSNLEELPQTFLQSFGIDELPGIKSLKRFLADFMSFFDVTTKHGKMLQGVVEDITNAMFGGLDAITKKDMARFFEGGVAVAKTLVSLIKDLWGWFEKILHGDWAGAFGSAVNVLIDVAHVIGAAIWEGIKAAMPGIAGGDGKSATEMAEKLIGKKEPGGYYVQAPGSETGFRWQATGDGKGALAAPAPAMPNFVTGGQSGIMLEGFHETRETEGMEALGSQAYDSLEHGWRSAAQQNSPSKKLLRLGEQAFESVYQGGEKAMEKGRGGGARPVQVNFHGDFIFGGAGAAAGMNPELLAEFKKMLVETLQDAAEEALG